MAVNPKAELVWQGRLHLGDEPGVYGDAAYCGLMTSIPFTAHHTPGGGHAAVSVSLETEDAETYAPYPGHEVSLVRHYPSPTNPQQWLEQGIATLYLNSAANNSVVFQNIDLSTFTDRICLSLRIRVDTSVPAGLYDDFIAIRVRFDAAPNYDYYASLGGDVPPRVESERRPVTVYATASCWSNVPS